MLAVVLADLVDRDDAGVVEQGDGLGLVLEAAQLVVAGEQAGPDHLEGDGAVEARPAGPRRRRPCRRGPARGGSRSRRSSGPPCPAPGRSCCGRCRGRRAPPWSRARRGLSPGRGRSSVRCRLRACVQRSLPGPAARAGSDVPGAASAFVVASSTIAAAGVPDGPRTSLARANAASRSSIGAAGRRRRRRPRPGRRRVRGRGGMLQGRGENRLDVRFTSTHGAPASFAEGRRIRRPIAHCMKRPDLHSRLTQCLARCAGSCGLGVCDRVFLRRKGLAD